MGGLGRHGGTSATATRVAAYDAPSTTSATATNVIIHKLCTALV